jgi:hypothetical protein
MIRLPKQLTIWSSSGTMVAQDLVPFLSTLNSAAIPPLLLPFFSHPKTDFHTHDTPTV